MAAVAAGRLILAPNAELTAALFDAVERAHRAAGLEVWPTPQVRDFSSWLREVHARRQLTDPIATRILSDVEERELWRAVVEASDVRREFVEAGAAARAARRARRVMIEYAIPRSAIALQSSADSQAFLDWNAAFEHRCRVLGCISSDTLLEGLAELSTPAMSWVDSPIWRPVARQWLARNGERLLPSDAPGCEARLVRAASATEELAAVAEWSRLNLQANESFRAWICVPDLNGRRADVIAAFDAVLAPQRFQLTFSQSAAPYAVAGGTPLSEYATVRGALDLLSASLGTLSFKRFSALLRLPELQEPDATEQTASLDVELRRCAPSDADLKTYLNIAERAAHACELGTVGAVTKLQAAAEMLDRAPLRQRFSGWLGVWSRAFNAAPWALRSRWSSTEYQAAERFRELLASLAMADDFFEMQSRESAQRILSRAARDTAFQAQTGVPQIWVSGQPVDPWLRYDGIWVTGCDDERWPPAADPVPMLPVGLQREYGVIAAGAESQLKAAMEVQHRWQTRAAHAVFSIADRGNGTPAAPSPLLRSMAASVSCVSPRPHWQSQLDRAPELESLLDAQAPPFTGGEQRMQGVATLRAQSRCAFRGFAETRLALAPLELPLPGFNDRERGTIVHHALEHVWTELRESTALQMPPDREQSLLDDAAARSIAKQCLVRDPGARWRVRERKRVMALLGRWLAIERGREPFTVEHLETPEQMARHGGLEFAVRIDRIDRLADGARVLIDYKTGAATKDWAGERPDNPQLPIYALLRPADLVAVAYGRVNAGDPGFTAECERRNVFKKPGRPSQLEGLPNFAALVERWAQRIDRLAADFAAGRAEVAPTAVACRSCHLQGLCRVPAALEDLGDADE